MISSTKCDKCGDLMRDNIINRENCINCTQYQCSKCGYKYEIGFRYNNLTKQHIKYVRFNQ